MSVLSTVATGLQWRSKMLSLKLSGQLEHIPWDVLWGEMSQRREFHWEQPPLITVEEDEEQGMVLLEIGGNQYWVAKSALNAPLPGIYKEAFHPTHPHHFEFEGAKIRKGDVVIDAGVFEGFFTRFALQKGARVIGVEPTPMMIASARRTYAKEIASGQLFLVQALLSDKPGQAKLVVDPNYPSTASSLHTHRDGLLTADVPELTIDQLVEQTPWKRCDFIKMDIEGSERPALAGAAKMMEQYKCAISIACYHKPSGFNDIRADILAKKLGYIVKGKGLEHGLDGKWRPVAIHAWVDPAQRPAPLP